MQETDPARDPVTAFAGDPPVDIRSIGRDRPPRCRRPDGLHDPHPSIRDDGGHSRQWMTLPRPAGSASGAGTLEAVTETLCRQPCPRVSTGRGGIRSEGIGDGGERMDPRDDRSGRRSPGVSPGRIGRPMTTGSAWHGRPPGEDWWRAGGRIVSGGGARRAMSANVSHRRITPSGGCGSYGVVAGGVKCAVVETGERDDVGSMDQDDLDRDCRHLPKP